MMEARIDLRASRPAGFIGLQNDPIQTPSVGSPCFGSAARGLRTGVVAAMALFLLVSGAGRLIAQQAPAQDWPPDDPAPGQAVGQATGQVSGQVTGQYAQSPQIGYRQQ